MLDFKLFLLGYCGVYFGERTHFGEAHRLYMMGRLLLLVGGLAPSSALKT
jgi:hypothetical protein